MFYFFKDYEYWILFLLVCYLPLPIPLVHLFHERTENIIYLAVDDGMEAVSYE